jgi:hypothetical protein
MNTSHPKPDVEKIKTTNPMIGRSIWLRDENQRVYVKGQSTPDFRGYFREGTIVGETSQSWIARVGGWDYKIDKRTEELRQPRGGWYGLHRRVYWSMHEVNATVQSHALRLPISQRILRLQDSPASGALLMKIQILLDALEKR